MSTENDSSASNWSVDFIERFHDNSSNDECVLHVENRTMRTRARTLSGDCSSEDAEDSKSSRGKRRSRARLKASPAMKTNRKACSLPSSSRRSSQKLVAEKTSTKTTPKRPTRFSNAPVRFGFEGGSISAQVEPKMRPKRKSSFAVTSTPEKIVKESKSARKTRVKAEPIVTPENVARESEGPESLKISLRRHGDSWTRKSVSFLIADPSDDESTPRRRANNSSRVLFTSSPPRRSAAKMNVSMRGRLNVSAKNLFGSSRRQSVGNENDSTPRRHSVRVRRSVDRYQYYDMRVFRNQQTSTPTTGRRRPKTSTPSIGRGRPETSTPARGRGRPKTSTPTTGRGRGRPRKLSVLHVMEDIVDTDYNTETSRDDSDINYEPPSRSIGRSGASTPVPSSTAGPVTPRKWSTPRTPRLSVKHLTPSLPTRSKLVSTPTTPKDRAMKALHISSVPDSLPCRAREFDTIYNFLLQKIRGVDGGFLYIYGIPGAGKTATVERVIKRLVADCRRKKVNKFEFIDINGMHLKKPKDAYCQIWRKLENDFVSAKRAKSLLEHKFLTVFSKQPIVLLIDEFDMLFNRTLSVVDTILDWIEQSKLIVVAIANSKDLIEEINKSSSKSRMLRERLCDVQFKTYTFQQLQEIIEDRLKNDNVFTKDAIQLLARKSALSGDVRLALNLCRRVLAEVGNLGENETVGIERVQTLLERIHKDPKIEFMKALSKQDQMLLRAIRDVILTSGCSSSSLQQKIYNHYKSLCIMDGVQVMEEFALFRSLRLLEAYAIVTLSETDCTIHTQISLGNNLDYVQMAFPPNFEH